MAASGLPYSAATWPSRLGEAAQIGADVPPVCIVAKFRWGAFGGEAREEPVQGPHRVSRSSGPAPVRRAFWWPLMKRPDVSRSGIEMVRLGHGPIIAGADGMAKAREPTVTEMTAAVVAAAQPRWSRKSMRAVLDTVRRSFRSAMNLGRYSRAGPEFSRRSPKRQ